MIPTALWTALAALVDDRAYPMKLPERATFPAITYFQVSATEGNTHGGYDNTIVGRWQISCWAETYGAAKALAESVKVAIRAFSGSLTQVVKKSYVDNETDLYEPDVKLYHIPVDFFMLCEEL
jgi:hypothetical protein